jgi:hypothetical protein
VVDATLESLIPASWSTFSSRWIVRGTLVGLRLAQSRQVTQSADLRWQHEARAHQPVLHQLADPLRVLDVGLASGDVAQVVRVEQPALKPIFERLKDGLPVHARCFHPDQRHPELRQPLGERRKPGERRAEHHPSIWCIDV